VIEPLARRPTAIEAFQAIRLAETAARRESPGPEGRGRPVGEDMAPAEEAIRLTSAVNLAFPAGSVAGYEPPAEGETGPPRLAVTLFGLVGPSGVLPNHLTAEVARAVRMKRPAIKSFLDLFLHRLASFFYRAWAKYRLPVAYERSGKVEDDISRSLYALSGLGLPHLRERLAVQDETVVHYAGHFARWPRSAAALEAMLADYLGLPVKIKQFEGTWIPLPPEERTALPSFAAPEGNFCRLAVDAVVGERVWDVRGKFQIRVGPIPWARFQALMPGSDDVQRLVELTRLYVGPAVSFNLRLILDRREVPEPRLGEGATRLSWTSWAVSRPPPADLSDAVFEFDPA
jgi:type VI secretion system protein ImpH